MPEELQAKDEDRWKVVFGNMRWQRNIISLLAVGMFLLVLMHLPAAFNARWQGGLRDALLPLATLLANARAWGSALCLGAAEQAQRHERLTLEMGQLRNEIRQLKALEQENAELRRLLALPAGPGYRLLAAQVVARALGGWWEMARLNKGLSAGLARDMPVISAEGLVGRIVEVSGNTADVLFLVDPHTRVSAKLARMDAFGIVRGQGVSLQGDSLCRMDFIMKEADILPGDEVVTSGLGGVFPAGLTIGYVEKVYLDRSGLYQHADIVPAADLKNITVVFVVLPEQPGGPLTETLTTSAGRR